MTDTRQDGEALKTVGTRTFATAAYPHAMHIPAITALAVAALMSMSTEGWALGIGDHAEVTRDVCLEEGLPPQLCLRAATAAYNVDAYESEAYEAHSMTGPGQSLCDAADATLQRIRDLGYEVGSQLLMVTSDPWNDAAGLAADAFGRALHTIHDNCAHHGMTDPQHAWTSTADLCEDTQLSPDIQPEALACARRETAAIMGGLLQFIEALGNARWVDAACCPDEGGGRGPYRNEECEARSLPSAGFACRFLQSASDWDGVDRQWDHLLMAENLRSAFLDALWDDQLGPLGACERGPIDAANPWPTVDVTRGPAHCTTIDLVCIGGADSAVGAEAVFGAEPTSPEPADAHGCGVTARPLSSPPLLPGAMLLVTLLLWRQRSSSFINPCPFSPGRASDSGAAKDATR